MKIYVNTASQPPTLASALRAQTDAEGVLRVYSANGASTISSFKFKRGTTVPVEAVFADAAAAAQVAKLRFGVKLAGRYDELLTAAAETDARVENEDGTVSFHLKLTFDAATIDAALRVNSDADDDVASASFISEIEWENAAGERTATETVATTIQNNVVRGATETSGAAAGEWTALMVIRMSWAEFSALGERNPDAVYFVYDAPSEVEEHDADLSAHAALVQQLAASTAAQIEAAKGEMSASDLAELNQRIAEAQEAAILSANATMRQETSANFAKFEAADSAAETGAKHGKSLLASTNADGHGGLIVAGSESATRAWTQNAARYTNAKIRAYGSVSNLAADFKFFADADGDGDVIARKRDLKQINAPVLRAPTLWLPKSPDAGAETANDNADGWGYYGTLGLLCGRDGDSSEIIPMEIAVYNRTTRVAYGAANNLYLELRRWDADAARWVLAWSSTHTRCWGNFDLGAKISFTMEPLTDTPGIPAFEHILMTFCRAADVLTGTPVQTSFSVTTNFAGMPTAAPDFTAETPCETFGYAPLVEITDAVVITPEALLAKLSS